MGVWAPCTEPDRSGCDLQAQGGLCDEVGPWLNRFVPEPTQPGQAEKQYVLNMRNRM